MTRAAGAGTRDARGPFAVLWRDGPIGPWTLDHTYNDARDAANGRAWHERQSGRMCRIVPLGLTADHIEEEPAPSLLAERDGLSERVRALKGALERIAAQAAHLMGINGPVPRERVGALGDSARAALARGAK